MEIIITPKKIERLVFIIIIIGLAALNFVLMDKYNKDCSQQIAQADEPVEEQQTADEVAQEEDITEEEVTEEEEEEPEEDIKPAEKPSCTPKFKCIDDYHVVWITEDCLIDRKKGKSCLEVCENGKCGEDS